MSEAVCYSSDGVVATITLDHFENHNALSTELDSGLRASLDEALTDAAIRVIVLTKLRYDVLRRADLGANGGRKGSPSAFPSILADIMDAPKPVVGRVAGGCVGGGVGLAAACDISVVLDSVRIGFTEARLGVAPAVISVVCLPIARRGPNAGGASGRVLSELFLMARCTTAAYCLAARPLTQPHDTRRATRAHRPR